MDKAITTVERKGRDVRYRTSVNIGGEILATQTVVTDREQYVGISTCDMLKRHEDHIMHLIRNLLFPR